MKVFRCSFRIPGWTHVFFQIADSIESARAKAYSEARRIGLLPRAVLVHDWCGATLGEVFDSGAYPELTVADKVCLLTVELRKQWATVNRTKDNLEMTQLVNDIERGRV